MSCFFCSLHDHPPKHYYVMAKNEHGIDVSLRLSWKTMQQIYKAAGLQ